MPAVPQGFRIRTSARVSGQTITLTWNPPLQVISTALAKRGARVQISTVLIFKKYADDIKDHMKRNHRWRNRTREAENKLDAVATPTKIGARITAWSGAYHGRFLEANPDFAVVIPTVDLFRPRVMEALRRVV